MKPLLPSSLTLAGFVAAALFTFEPRSESTQAEDASAAPPAAAANNDPNETVSATVLPDTIPGTDRKLSEKLRELIQLAERGLGDDVLIAWINNSMARFNLTADEIVYLTDVGISEAVIKAMIEHKSASTDPSKPSPAPGAPPINPTIGQVPPGPLPEAPKPAPSVVINAAPEFETAPSGVQPVQVVYVNQPVQYDYFYSSLSPYGSWVDVDGYGRCWRPTVAVIDRGWRPYFHGGRWQYTDRGWYWQSDYSWGWAPFHYGRWSNHARSGWVWKPDLIWSPAWVTWRWSDSHCGWAPLPPGSHYRSGVGLTYHHSSSSGVSVSFGFGLTDDCYSFVPTSHFRDRTPWRHGVPRHHVAGIYNNTTVINNFTARGDVIVNEGPGRDRVAAATRSEVPKLTIRDIPAGQVRLIKSDRLENGGRELAVYRPLGSTLSARESVNTEPRVAGGIRTRTSAPASPGATVKSGNPPVAERTDPIAGTEARVGRAITERREVRGSVPVVRTPVPALSSTVSAAPAPGSAPESERTAEFLTERRALANRPASGATPVIASPVAESRNPARPADVSTSPNRATTAIRSSRLPGSESRSGGTESISQNPAPPPIAPPLVHQNPAPVFRRTISPAPTTTLPTPQIRVPVRQVPSAAPAPAPLSVPSYRQEVPKPVVTIRSPEPSSSAVSSSPRESFRAAPGAGQPNSRSYQPPTRYSPAPAPVPTRTVDRASESRSDRATTAVPTRSVPAPSPQPSPSVSPSRSAAPQAVRSQPSGRNGRNE